MEEERMFPSLKDTSLGGAGWGVGVEWGGGDYFWMQNKPPTVRLFNSLQSPGIPSKLISFLCQSLSLFSYPSPSVLFEGSLGTSAQYPFLLPCAFKTNLSEAARPGT